MSKVRSKLWGVGVNDAPDNISINERVDGRMTTLWRCPYYKRWADMLKRCYGHSGYIGCSVCPEWLLFTNFRGWMEEEEWEDKELDKDLLKEGNKVYSPDTCIFVSKDVNCLLLIRSKGRGLYPLGVCYDKSRDLYQAHCNTLQGKVRRKRNLGRFKTPLEAHRAWQKAKKDQALLLQSKQTCPRTIKGLQRVIDKLTDHIEKGIETKSL